MNETELRADLRAYITREMMHDAGYALRDDEEFITDGRVDSYALATLGVYIEDAYNLYIPDPDLTVEKLGTLDRIVARVLRG